MTLAEFARQIGVTPATARQMKRRGKIVERDGGFALAEGMTAHKRDSESPAPKSVTPAVIVTQHGYNDLLACLEALERDSVCCAKGHATATETLLFGAVNDLSSRLKVCEELLEYFSRLDIQGLFEAHSKRIRVLETAHSDETDVALLREYVGAFESPAIVAGRDVVNPVRKSNAKDQRET